MIRKILAMAALGAAVFTLAPAHADTACANVYINGNKPLTCAPGSAPIRATVVSKTQYHGAGVDGLGAVAVRYNNPVQDLLGGHLSTSGTGVGVWIGANDGVLDFCFTVPPGGVPPFVTLNGTCPLYPDF